MKLQQLRQIIREEISEMINSPSPIKFSGSTGIISFGQLKQAVIKSYAEFGTTGEELIGPGIINKATDIDELVNVLDGLGFNGKEAYDFIFDSILK